MAANTLRFLSITKLIHACKCGEVRNKTPNFFHRKLVMPEIDRKCSIEQIAFETTDCSLEAPFGIEC